MRIEYGENTRKGRNTARIRRENEGDQEYGENTKRIRRENEGGQEHGENTRGRPRIRREYTRKARNTEKIRREYGDNTRGRLVTHFVVRCRPPCNLVLLIALTL